MVARGRRSPGAKTCLLRYEVLGQEAGRQFGVPGQVWVFVEDFVF